MEEERGRFLDVLVVGGGLEARGGREEEEEEMSTLGMAFWCMLRERAKAATADEKEEEEEEEEEEDEEEGRVLSEWTRWALSRYRTRQGSRMACCWGGWVGGWVGRMWSIPGNG